MQKNKKIRLFVLLFGISLFAACSQIILYSDLNQEDANKVLVLLERNGIDATLKQERRQNEIFWSVQIDPKMASKARELIVSSQVISPRAPGLQEVYQTKGGGGWIKSPAEERARYLLALKGEIINSLKRLPEIVDVDVVLNMPEEEGLHSELPKRPTASVVVKAKTPELGQPALSEMKIQQFVANAVEGMSPRDVAVLLHYLAPEGAILRPGETILLTKMNESKGGEGVSEEPLKEPVQLMGLTLDTASRQRLKIYLVIFFGVLTVLSIALVVSILQASRNRQTLKALQSGEERQALQGQVMEGGRPRLKSGEEEQ